MKSTDIRPVAARLYVLPVQMRMPLKFGRLLGRSAPSLAKVVAGIWTRQLKLPIRVPRTRFNGNVTPNRVFDGRMFSLSSIKAIKNSQPGTTVNDVVVTICGERFSDNLGDGVIADCLAFLRRAACPGDEVRAIDLSMKTRYAPPTI